MLCIHCGHEIADNAVYCVWCGTSLVGDATPRESYEFPQDQSLSGSAANTIGMASTVRTVNPVRPSDAARRTSGTPRHASTTSGMKTQNEFTYRTSRPIVTKKPRSKAPAIVGAAAAVALVSGIATNGFGLLNESDASSSSSSAATQIVVSQSGEAASSETTASTGSQAGAAAATASASMKAIASNATSAAANLAKAASSASAAATTVPAAGDNPITPHETTIAEPEAPSSYSGGSPTYPFWGVWVGAYKVQGNAEKTVARLQGMGYSAYMLMSSEWTNLNQDDYHVVTAGVYDSEADARAALAGVKSAGYETAYVRYSGSLK